VTVVATAPQVPDAEQPLCNLLYAALAVDAGAKVEELLERDRYPQLRLDTKSLDREKLARDLEALAAQVRAMPKEPTHRDLARVFTASIAWRIDKLMRGWKRIVKERRRETAPQRATVLSTPAQPPVRVPA